MKLLALASACRRAGFCNHLRSEPTDEDLSLSAFQMNETTAAAGGQAEFQERKVAASLYMLTRDGLGGED